jgi:nucleotide-binding universal stress UspA family protein
MAFPACPITMEKLLVCTDASPASQGAVAGALALAQTCRSRLYLLEIMEYNLGYTGLAPEGVIRWEQEVSAHLEAIKARAEELGVAAEPLVRRADAAYAAIVEAAQKLEADLIIMGRRGRSGLARLLMGSVTERVIGLSPVSVLVIPREANLTWERLLIASDGSPYSEAAWEQALELVRRLDARLLGVSVAREEGELPEAEAVVQRLLMRANRQGIPMQIQVTVGAPDDVIVQTALGQQTDLIIVGSHGRTGLKRLLMGSTAARVIGQAPCPVLVVKRPE